MRLWLLAAGAMLILSAADLRADAFCFKCSTDYRCTSTTKSAYMQCMATWYGCRAWDPCSTSPGAGDCRAGDPDCVEDPAPTASINDEKPWRLVGVSIAIPRRPLTQYASLDPEPRP